jgi:hypothetical protein
MPLGLRTFTIGTGLTVDEGIEGCVVGVGLSKE